MSATPHRQKLTIDDLREPGKRGLAEEMFQAAVRAVEPSRLVVRAFQTMPSAIKDALHVRRGRLVVVGAGKAAGAMAAALEDALPEPAVPDGVTPPPRLEGLVVVKRGGEVPRLRGIEVREAAHPVPDEAGQAAAEDMLRIVASLGESDILFGLFSGGGSALLPAPVHGVTLADLQATTDLLLQAGATIHELNAVRKHLSRISGGQLARASRAAANIVFLLSDVPGDKLDSIASGPTVADETTFRDALAALRKHKLVERVPKAVAAHIERGARGQILETPKPGDKAFARSRTVVIGSNRTALEAAAALARERGFPPVIVQGGLSGEARLAGETFAKRLLLLREKAPRAVIAGGETTVEVKGDGKGGRSQEVALGAAFALAGEPGICILAAGTDGEDGPTDAAGAIVDGATLIDAHQADLDPKAALERNDSYGFFAKAGGHLKTGPTGTNVMDMAIGLIS